MLVRALAHTAHLWPPIYLAYYSWVHRAAHILKNEENLRVEELRREYRYLLNAPFLKTSINKLSGYHQ